MDVMNEENLTAETYVGHVQVEGRVECAVGSCMYLCRVCWGGE